MKFHSPGIGARYFIDYRRAAVMQWCVLLFLTVVLAGCKHIVRSEVRPSVIPPPEFSQPTRKSPPESKWWQSFNDPFLNETIEKSFRGNFSLQQARERITQARISAGQAGADLYPIVDGDLSVGSSWFQNGVQQKRYVAVAAISWELDLWDRLSSKEKALHYEAGSAADNYQAATLLFSGMITENYLYLVEQELQLQLLKKQMAANSTFLELIELRFANGEASVVDIYQQRQQLAAVKSQFPIVNKQVVLLKNRLSVLTGTTPGTGRHKISATLPELPSAPATGIPADLLLHRPDLKSLHNQLLAADHKIAEAVADRLPGLRLTGSTGFSGASFSADNLFFSVMGEIFAPILDWKKRKNEVSKRESRHRELLAEYSQTFLIAMEEIENGLWTEKYQTDLMQSLSDQLRIAKATLAETRNRYMQGLTDYLPVLTTLQSLQRLERELLARKRELLVIRVRLYRALGGSDIPIIPRKEDRP